MRTRAVIAVALSALLAAALGGCAKRAWYARGGDAAPAPVMAPADTAARTGAQAPPRQEARRPPPPADATDPVASGGTALPAREMRVSEELPWVDEPVPPPGGPPAGAAPPAADCAGRPCHWIQVAAPVDSFGCAGVLARARAVAAASGPGVIGGRILSEGGLWKVQVGPFAEWEAADRARGALRAEGFPDAWLVRR